MKKLFLLLSLALGLSAAADEVNPIDTDSYKSVVVTVKMLDDRLLKDATGNSVVYFELGSVYFAIPAKSAQKGTNVKKQLTIPLDDRGNYSVRFCPNYGISSCDILVVGELKEGIFNYEVRLKRIDINNMKVTRPDGSTYIVENGIASIRSDGGLNQSIYTNTGIDVAVGYVYDVKVRAETEDGPDSYSVRLDYTKL